MNVDVREYELEEVSVKINKTRRVITISAEHKSQFESRSTYREFTLPAGAPDSNPDAIDAVLSPNGILTITGPCTPQTLPAAITDVTDNSKKIVDKQQQQNTSVQQQQQKNTSVQQQTTSVQQQQQNTTVQQQQQQNTSVKQQQQNTTVQQQQQNTSVQQLQDTSVQQHQSQIVEKRQYMKITRETFTSSTMTSLDIAEAEVDEPPTPEPDTPVEDVTQDMLEDEDGNLIVEVNVKGYQPEEITVKASKTTITIVLRKKEDIRQDNVICKTVHVPLDVVVTQDKIRSILDRAKGTLIIMITKKSVTTTETQQITDRTTEEQNIEKRKVDSVQQQKRQQEQVQEEQETVEETQVRTQTTQQQINQQKQIQQKQRSIEETQTQIETQQQINQQKQVQKKEETVQETQTRVQTQQQIDQQRKTQQKQTSIEETQIDTQQQTSQQKQQIQQQDQRQQNTSTTTTSKRTIKTTTTTLESLQKLGYNFDSATSQVYTGDPTFFERSTPIVDYKPEELEVKIAMPWVIIEGKQEMTAENGWRSKQFTRMFTVPEGTKQENILLELNEAGDAVNCTARIG